MVNIDKFSKDDVKELTFTEEEQKELKEARECTIVFDEDSP